MIISSVRRAAAIVLTVGALVLPATAPAVAHATTSPAATTIGHVYPFTATGALKHGYVVSHTYGHAICSPGSDIAASANRCFAGNLVFDPCFAANGVVVCLPDPFSTTLTKLTGNTRNTDAVGGKNQLWGIKLANGNTCVFADGARASVGVHTVSYYCKHGGAALLDGPDRHRKVWTIRTVATDSKGRQSVGKAVPIAEVVYAAAPS